MCSLEHGVGLENSRLVQSSSQMKTATSSRQQIRGVRGSDGSALRALRRRTYTAIGAVAGLSVMGGVVAFVLISPSIGTTEVVAVAHGESSAVTAVEAEALDDQVSQTGKISGKSQISGAAPSAKERKVEAASRSVTKTELPGCSGNVPGGMAANGELPENWLCDLGVGSHQLRADAAIAFAEMNAAFKKDTGHDLALTDTYRPLEDQISIASRKPGLAAAPGTSLHGWGLAIDFGGGAASASGPQYEWLVKNAAKYGWENPAWAKSDVYEPWHWEYVPGRKSLQGEGSPAASGK